MDKETRNAIERATQKARKILEEDFSAQLEGDFDVHPSGAVAAKAGPHLSRRQAFQREKIVAAIEHKRAAGMQARDAVADYLRDAAFTTFNRFVALKMLEARELVQECITKGEQSSGYREFCGLAPGLPLLAETAGYRLYIESLFDELSTEVKVLFDRRDPSSVLWPRRATFEQLLATLNAEELKNVWGEDETIGWVYQFFNGQDERRKMREESQAPRNSRELAVRNQFFTPRYVVQFLTDNTLGRIWYEMRGTNTALADHCDYMVRKPGEEFAPRAKKDPRDIRVLDPACGSGHFLLYAFDLLLTIYEEAHSDVDSPTSEATGNTLAEDYPRLDELRNALPGLILAHNLHGVDIDARCVQIAQLALWMRAQKAYREWNVARAQRLQIRRSNVVVAEPLVADKTTLDDYLDTLPEQELRRAFSELIEDLKLAGEQGLLLRTQGLCARGADRGDTGHLFAPPGARLHRALEDFAAVASSNGRATRQLFIDDAVQGLGLVEIARKNYDAILMNPPFGDPPARSAKQLNAQYLAAKHDISSAFLERAESLLSPRGMVGAIATRTIFFLQYLRDWRETFLFGRARLTVFADLGIGVLDAMVETCLVCFMRKGDAAPNPTHFVLANKQDQREFRLKTASLGGKGNRTLEQEKLRKIPGSPLAFTMSDEVLALFASSNGIETNQRGALTGALTQDDFRFVRAWWEVPVDAIARTWTRGTSKRWVPYVSGGSHTPIYADVRSVLNWRNDGEELKAFLTAYRAAKGFADQWTSQLNSYENYFRRGVAWSLRPLNQGSFWLLPDGCVFGNNAPALLAREPGELAWLVGILNSAVFRAILGLLMPRGNTGTSTLKYNLGYVRSVPVPEPVLREKQRMASAVAEAWRELRRLDSRDETSHSFDGAAFVGERDHTATANTIDKIRVALSTVETIAADMYRVPASVLSDLAAESGVAPCEQNLHLNPIVGFARDASDPFYVVEFIVGCVFSRWDAAKAARPLTREGRIGSMPDHPAVLAQTRPHHARAIAVCDAGHEDDLVAAMGEVLRAMGFASVARTIDNEEVADLLCGEFFARHIAHYRTSTRKAPIYWHLATPSASYSVWLYVHAFTGDTLFRVQNEYAGPKLAHEERRLKSLSAELRDGATAGQRKALAAQEAFVEELRAFLDEVKRVAPLWNPNLDDGVVINFAPLWRLVPQNKSWQKELKSTWDALCQGDYDWAHLAMHLWPERVVPKCAKDRSLAIAHGLEEVFWGESADGKWSARKTPTRSIEELVRERVSPAVRTSLKSLLEAPAATSNGGRARVGRRRSTVADRGDA